MKSTLLASLLSILVVLLIAAPALAAGPTVSKSVLAGDDDSAVILIRVSAGSRDIYGVTVEDPSGSIEDIVAPNGWCSIATESQAAFRTGDRPVKQGKSIYLRIVTKNKNAKLGVTFRDAKTLVGSKKTI